MKLLEKLKIDLVIDSRDRYKEAVLSLLENGGSPNLLTWALAIIEDLP